MLTQRRPAIRDIRLRSRAVIEDQGSFYMGGVPKITNDASEADSEVLAVQVSWDGQWHDGATEMQRHLVIRVV